MLFLHFFRSVHYFLRVHVPPVDLFFFDQNTRLVIRNILKQRSASSVLPPVCGGVCVLLVCAKPCFCPFRNSARCESHLYFGLYFDCTRAVFDVRLWCCILMLILLCGRHRSVRFGNSRLWWACRSPPASAFVALYNLNDLKWA